MSADDESEFRQIVREGLRFVETAPAGVVVANMHFAAPASLDLTRANRIVREEAEVWGGEWVTALLKLHGLAASQRCDPVPGY